MVFKRRESAASSATTAKEEGKEDYDPNFDRKLDLAVTGAQPFVKEHLLTKIT